MAWDTLLSALALVLVVEGILPFVAPEGWRRSMLALAQQPNSVLRIVGLGMMLIGLVVLYVV